MTSACIFHPLAPAHAADDGVRDAMSSEKLFPIQTQRGAEPHPLRIPWSIAELAYSVYAASYGRGQSLERLADRGGFGPDEMDMFLPGWRGMCSELDSLRAELARVTEERNAARECERAKDERIAELEKMLSDSRWAQDNMVY